MVLASNCQTAQILPPSQSVHSLRFLIAVLKLEIDDLQAKGIWPMTTWRVLGLRADNDGKLPTVIIVIVLDDETQVIAKKFFFTFCSVIYRYPQLLSQLSMLLQESLTDS